MGRGTYGGSAHSSTSKVRAYTLRPPPCYVTHSQQKGSFPCRVLGTTSGKLCPPGFGPGRLRRYCSFIAGTLSRIWGLAASGVTVVLLQENWGEIAKLHLVCRVQGFISPTISITAIKAFTWT